MSDSADEEDGGLFLYHAINDHYCAKARLHGYRLNSMPLHPKDRPMGYDLNQNLNFQHSEKSRGFRGVP